MELPGGWERVEGGYFNRFGRFGLAATHAHVTLSLGDAVGVGIPWWRFVQLEGLWSCEVNEAVGALLEALVGGRGEEAARCLMARGLLEDMIESTREFVARHDDGALGDRAKARAGLKILERLPRPSTLRVETAAAWRAALRAVMSTLGAKAHERVVDRILTDVLRLLEEAR